ncbi:phosphatase PAP2 family protein [Ruegeria arenilitoris]|uniref:phosphatase PAP2 family protein n=1 Tax=Ruegeria arenilitoris TaxID=1173585 RepID=UPI0020C4EA34|nr:phosphatase PAP2 family protein [Ruegeria arenilitoris]
MTYPLGSTASGVSLREVIWRNRLLVSIVALHALAGIAVGQHLGISYWSSASTKILGVLLNLSAFAFANYVLWRFAVAVFRVKPKKPISWMIADFRKIVSNRSATSDTLIGFMCIAVLTVSYSYLKTVLPLLQPYSWDPLFANLDRTLHGQDTWQLLWPVLGNPYVTTLVNLAYHSWFFLIYIAVCLACFDRRNPGRSMVFLVAFALCWSLGGNLFATLFASVGPVYFEVFGFGDTFTHQMELLHASNEISPVAALQWQQVLFDGHFNGGPIRGISAMPSMHVATSTLLAIYAFSYTRWLGWLMTAFAVVILVGSIHLAWHYAVDGYAALLLAILCWRTADLLNRRFGPTAPRL